MDEQNTDRQSDPPDTGAPSALPYLSPWKPLRRLSLEGVTVVACRVLALWAGIQVLQTLTYSLLMSIAAVATSPWSTFHWSIFTSQLILLPQMLVFGAAGAVLWFKAGWLSERITRIIPAQGTPDHPIASDGHNKSPLRSPVEDAAPLLGILLTVVGVFILAEAVSELGRAISAPLYVRDRNDAEGWVSIVLESPSFWPAIIKCAIGAWLLLGPGGIARLVLKLRKSDPNANAPAADTIDDPDGPL